MDIQMQKKRKRQNRMVKCIKIFRIPLPKQVEKSFKDKKKYCRKKKHKPF